VNDWQPIETVPNNVFDVLAKHYDASTDQFWEARFAGCVQVDGRILWASPFFGDERSVDLVAAGYRPTYWMHIPEPPAQPVEEK
jgi:hypothetical protein